MLILRVILFQVFDSKKLIKLLENQVSFNFVETTVITFRKMHKLYFNVELGDPQTARNGGGQGQISLFGGKGQMSPLTTFINDFQSLKRTNGSHFFLYDNHHCKL